METMNTLVTAQRIRRVLVLHCRGELDLATRDELWTELAALADLPAGDGPNEREPDLDAVVVDLAEVTFLDCSAGGGLASRRTLARTGRSAAAGRWAAGADPGHDDAGPWGSRWMT